MNKELTIKERAALLMGLMSNSSSVQMPTKEAREALKILNSLQTNTSKTKGPAKIIKNPVTNTKVVMSQNPNAGGGNDVSFTTGRGYQRPGKPNSPTQLQGIQATLNQMLSEIPIKGTTGDSRYTASPIFDEKDLDRSLSGRGSYEGQRARAYRRMTKGAFALPPDTETMRGNRLGESRWQPRGAKSRYAKAVNYDLTDVVKQLGIKGATRTAIRSIPVIGKYLQAYMTAEDTVKGLTGKSPTGESIKFAQESIRDQSMPRPATLMIR